MKTSVRNVFNGKVKTIKVGAVNDEVILEIAPNLNIAAIITHESTLTLGLETGKAAFALIKAPFIIIATNTEGVKLSTRNMLVGTIKSTKAGAVNTEVDIDLGEGKLITSIITNTSAENLKLKVGGKATAIFKASSVILGTKA